MAPLNKNYTRILGTDTVKTIDDTNNTQLSQIEADMTTIEGHLNSSANPHAVTAAQAGAEPVNANIQTHIADVTTNPHAVSAAQVGKDTAQWNADKIKGITVASLAGIADTNVIKYNSSTQQFEPGAASVVANINDLADVTITTPVANEILKYNGSAWINEAISGASIITNETPTGLVNSSNTVYTTAHDFVATKISVYVNRTRLKLNEDYTETASNGVTLTVAPTTGDDIWVDYVRSDTVLVGDTSYQRINETPTGLVNSSNTVYDTAETFIAGSLQVFLNGQLQALTIDYAETDTNTFTMVTAPLTDDTLRVTYQTALTPAGNADTLDGQHASFFFNSPRGYMMNGKLTVTNASGITVALKTLEGTDPSTLNPVYIRIGDTIRSINSSISVVLADGTNWMNAGSAELATKEIDYFVYAVWDSNSSAVALSFARIPYANLVSEFSATTTNEKYCAGYSGFTTTDEVENIGRFTATLSAGAGYTWSVPTFTAINLIQRPIWETRTLSFAPVAATVSGTMTSFTTDGFYTLTNRLVTVKHYIAITNIGTGGTALSLTVPFAVKSGTDAVFNGRESSLTGLTMSGMAINSVVTYNTYSNGFPGGNGHTNFSNGVYRID